MAAEAAACDAAASLLLLQDAGGMGRRHAGVGAGASEDPAAAAAAVRALAQAQRGASGAAESQAEGAGKLAAEMQLRADDHGVLAAAKHLLAVVALDRLRQVRACVLQGSLARSV